MFQTQGARPWACALALAGLCTSATALAQGSPIRQGFDAAWLRQPEQRAAPLRREAAAAAATAAQRWTPEPPALELSTRTDRVTQNRGVREYDALVAVPLWLPGERARAQALAASEVGSVDARLAAAQWRLAAEVREAFWARQRAQLEHELARQRLASAQAVAGDVARRVKAGDLARADGHQAAAAVAAAQGALAEAEVALAQAAQGWLALTGQPAADGAGEPRPAEPAAPALHPALRELGTRADLARRQRELAGVQTRSNPELTIGAVHERDGFGERYGQRVVVGLRFPLGTSTTGPARRATASADLLEAEAQLELETERLRAQQQAARARVSALEAAQAAAEQRAVLTREARGFFEKSYRLGETDLPTRLRIEHEAFEAERQAARSRLELDAAISQLRQALGLLPE